MAETQRKHGFFRTNVEAFAIAIAVAMTIKTFAVEAFVVPTPSMEPTIIGRTSGGDRLLVNKNRYVNEDPEPFDIVVFRYSLSRMLNYVKRCVGLSNERILISHGDIYRADKGSDDFVVRRKPIHLVDSMFASNPLFPEEDMEDLSERDFLQHWKRPTDRTNHKVSGGSLELRSDGPLVSIQTRGSIELKRNDPAGPPPSEAQTRSAPNYNYNWPIGDLRIQADLTAKSSKSRVHLEILDATQPLMPLKLELAVDGSDDASQLTHGELDVTPEALKSWKLPSGEDVSVIFENCDDRVRVLVDDEEVCTYLYAQSHKDDITHKGDLTSKITVGTSGGNTTFRSLRLYRDTYYTPDPTPGTIFEIPDGCFIFMGDNSISSLDGRAWKAVGIRIRETGEIVIGDKEAVWDDSDWPRRYSNPYFESDPSEDLSSGRPPTPTNLDEHHFLDLHGNTWRLEPRSYDLLNLNAFTDYPDLKILELHGTTLENPKPEQIMLEAVSSPVLREVWKEDRRSASHTMVQASTYVHFIPREDLLGQANFVFFPVGRWGVVR